MTFDIFWSILLGYFFGTVSFSAIWAKFYKINLREIGSKNIGATNLSRAIGWNKTLTPAILDGGKCFLAFLILKFLFKFENEPLLVGMIFTAVGHIWPFWNKFYGGKGVAVSFGFMFATLNLWYALTIVVLFILLYKKTRVMLYSSMFLVIFSFIGSFFLAGNYFTSWTIMIWPYTLTLTTIVIVKHRTNFMRMWKKNELKS